MAQFSPKGAARVKAAVVRSERTPRNTKSRGRLAGSYSALPIHAKTGGSGIGAASSVTQMTSATVTIWTCDDSGALSATTSTVTCWNKSTTAVGANKHILMQAVAGVGYVCIWEEC